MIDTFLTVEEAAELAGVHGTSIQRWCRDKLITAVKVGTAWAISRENLEQYVKNNPQNGRGYERTKIPPMVRKHGADGAQAIYRRQERERRERARAILAVPDVAVTPQPSGDTCAECGYQGNGLIGGGKRPLCWACYIGVTPCPVK